MICVILGSYFYYFSADARIITDVATITVEITPFEIKEERRREPDCDNDFIQPRPFNSFTTQNTCGCENKSE